MNNITQEELQLIQIIRTLKPFESIEFKCDEHGKVAYTHKIQTRYFLTRNLNDLQ